MSCARRRLAGSGYVKPDNPELEVQNNCALAALMAAREQQDAALQGMWGDPAETKTESRLPPPIPTVPPSDTCFEVDGHFYKVPDVERAEALHKSLATLTEERSKEEAKWAAHWTQPAPNTEIVEQPASGAETKTELSNATNTSGLPHIEITELS